MQFSSPLVKGVLLKRYKRFLADVRLPGGELVTAHCPNTGAMTGCAEPGFEVWLSTNKDPKRKLAYTWELAINDQQQWIGINTHNANKLVVEGINKGVIVELMAYQGLRQEVKYGAESSRIDVLLTADGKPDCYVEVKSVTLLQDGRGWFPDAKTVRGQKHLRELSLLVEQGKRAVMCFCVQHSGIKTVSAASFIDPDYALALNQACAAGVEIICYGCEISEEKIELNQSLKYIV
jgi:sugar fermentation stimulation protein A